MNRFNLFAILLFLFLAAPKVATAEESSRSANQLATDCRELLRMLDNGGASKSTEPMSAGNCAGYFSGLSESIPMETGLLETLGAPTLICIPDSATVEQLVRVFMKSVDENPEGTHEHRYFFAREALTKAFPCEKRQ